MAAILVSLTMTVLIESVVVFLLTSAQKHHWRLLALVCCVNGFTNCLLNALLIFVVYPYGLSLKGFLIIAEGLVILLEAAIYTNWSDFSKKESFKLSLLANFCSVFLGEFLWKLLG